MKIVENQLFLEFKECNALGIPERTLKEWKEPLKISDPADARYKLINYELLQDKYKILVRAKFGNPYEHVVKEPIKKLVRKDFKAEEFFEKFELENGSRLPKQPRNYVQEYSTAASWLNMIVETLSNKLILKKQLHISLEQFWKNTCELIEVFKVELPSSERNLRERVKEYKLKGYECLVSKKFGNSNSMKVGKTMDGTIDADVAAKQIAMIRRAASLHQNFTPEEIAINVNPVFKKNDWQMLSRATISNILDANKHIITPGRAGTRIYNSTIARQVVRERPHHPLQYVTLDGWTVELLYQDENGFDNRLVAVIVLDVMNNYPLGYAIGDRENVELIRAACRNAIAHAKDLFGDNYRPWQIQSDHYGMKALTPFYEAMGHLFTPAAVGNAKSKVIEPFFKDLNKKYCKYYPNWSGFNINSRKENQPNSEYLDKIKRSFPDKKGCELQIKQVIECERKVKRIEYMEAWVTMPPDLKPALLDTKQLINVYGKSTGYLNTITGRGLLPTIEGEKLIYDSFEPEFRALQHLKWRVTYLPDNLEKIVATSEDGKCSFLLDQTKTVGMGFMNRNEGDTDYVAKINQFNKNRKEEIIDTYARDAALVEDIMRSTPLSMTDENETRIKLMFTQNGQQKERLQDAKHLGHARKINANREHKDLKREEKSLLEKQVEYLDSKQNFEEYL